MSKQPIPGDKLWDEILKAIAYVMPKQILPLIKEVYGKEYPPDAPVRFLATEHSTCLDSPQKTPSSRRMDFSLLVADADFYHIECQMKNDRLMVIRMISYDLHYSIVHCMSGDGSGEIIIRFPHSAVLYPAKNRKLPESLRCRVIFQDGSEHLYQIPAIRIQTYSLEEIREKHLDLFIPYLLLRLKPRLDSKKRPLTKKDLTAFLNDIILLLQEEMDTGHLTEQECSYYMELLVHASKRVFHSHPDYHAEVESMTKPLIHISGIEIMDLKASLEKMGAVLAERDSALAEKDSALAEKDSEIASLRAQLAALSNQRD